MVRHSVSRVFAPSGRRRAHPLFAFALAVALCITTTAHAQVVAPSVNAAVLRSQSYSPEALPNALGPAIERNCLARGGAGPACHTVAQRAGGVGNGYGITKVLENAWTGAKDYSSWDQTMGVIVAGCSSGAFLGFIAGGIASSPVAGVLGPPGAGIGCGVGALGGVAAILGSAVNGSVRCIVKDCSVKTQTDSLTGKANAEGSGVSSSDVKTKPGNMPGFTIAVDSNGTALRTSMVDVFNQVGYNNFFLFRVSANGWWREGFFFDANLREQGDGYGVIRSGEPFQVEAGMRFCSGYYRTDTCIPGKTNYYLVDYVVPSSIPGNYGLMLGGTDLRETGTTMPDRARRVIQPVENAPLFTMPYSGLIKPEMLSKEVSPSILADIANAAYKLASESGLLPPGAPLYDPTAPITPTDIDQARALTNTNPVRLGDVISAPTIRQGQESIPGGTLDGPTKPPIDVNPVGGGTNGGSGDSDGGSENGDDDVEWTPPEEEPGDIYQPWRDWMEGPFRQYLHPTNIVPDSINGCPAINLDFTEFMRGTSGLAPNPQSYTQECDFLLKPLKGLGGKTLREILVPIFHMLATWAGFKILMTGRARG